ncbi:MAG: hypothetical protein Q7R54_02785 [bacterium]|nr:hypothetical protein [bacterium]
MTQETSTTAPDSGQEVVKTFGDGSKMVVDTGKAESPFAALAAVKADGTNAPVADADAEVEVERTAEENALLATEVLALLAAADLAKPKSEVNVGEGEKRGRRRHKRSRKPEATASASASGEVAGGESTPPAPAPKQKPQSRAPQFGSGKVRLLLVPQSVERERSKSPRGTITLMQLLSAEHPMSSPLLARIAVRIAERKEEPSFVVFARTEKGFDHVRVAVRTKPSGRDEALLVAHFVITEATGHYADLLQYKDEAIHFGPLLRGKPTPRGEEKRTDALREVIAEAANAINESIARRQEGASK